MNHDAREPLTDEERALAAQLGRASRGPAADVDARILAAARAALPEASSRPLATPRARRRRPRWPMALGVAATLVLAVGLGWQMRPREASVEAYSEAPASAVRAIVAAPESVQADAADASVAAAASGAGNEVATPPPPGVQEQRPLSPRVASNKPEPAATMPAAPAAEPESQPEDTAVTQAVQASAPAAFPASPPPPPPPAVAPVPSPAAVAGDAAPSTTALPAAQARVGRAPVAEAAKARTMSAPSPVAAPVAAPTPVGAADEDAALDERPPITTESMQMRQAWLVRIRTLLAHGRIAEARASLAEFQRRYPDAVLPDDLHALAEPKPAP